MSTRVPKNLTLVGVVSLAIGIVALVFTVMGFSSLTPEGIVDAQGEPGSDVLLSVGVSEPGVLDSPGDMSYALWEVSDNSDEGILGRPEVEVIGPDGESLEMRNASRARASNSEGLESRTFAEFRTTVPGTYTVTIRPLAETDVDRLEVVLVTETVDVGNFIGGASISAVLMLIGISGSIVGFVLTAAGLIWWGVTSSRKRSWTQAGSGGKYPSQQGPPPPAGPSR